MFKPFRNIAKFSSTKKGATIVLSAWVLVAILFAVLLPSANDYSQSTDEGSVNEDTPSKIADDVFKEAFPSDDGLPALLVFHNEDKLTDADLEEVSKLSEWLASDDKPAHVSSALPFHKIPEKVWQKMVSDDGTTLIFNLSLEKDIESDVANETLDMIRDKVDTLGFSDVQFEITGPAGISADTISLFKNADIVLMIATVVLIFIILIAIYRSPILAITPLIIAGIVYGVVNGVIGFAGEQGWFIVDSSAVSIMLVLLFAVITDYSLFVFSRFKEELGRTESKFASMREAIYHVSEPIFFSGGTIFLAMLTLFTTVFKPYNHFAPVFSIAIVIILIAGLTLIPSMFALMGRKAFWPFIPKYEPEKVKKEGIWAKISRRVAKHPVIFAGILLIILLAGIFNATQMKFSFNMMSSFPDDISSRQGFELLESHYPPGKLAPVDVVLNADEEIDVNKDFLEKAKDFRTSLAGHDGVKEVTPEITDDMLNSNSDLPRGFLADNGKAIDFEVILDDNPYDVESLDIVEDMRNLADGYLADSGLSEGSFDVHFAGQTAEQVDVRNMNKRDMIILFSIVIVLLTFVIGFQTRSVLMPVLMMFTILLSYAATLGFGWWIFEHVFGYSDISYRLPVYTFVFMVALGVDYNIMLVSRIKEMAKTHSWRDAVIGGVTHTGGVISSAGIILAATFSVLMTQPLEELFLFGFTMALGILLDTFLIRGVLFPSLLLILKRK